MHDALGRRGDVTVAELKEFDLSQIKAYLRKKRLELFVPDWLPSRPLLLSYLAVNEFLSEGSTVSHTLGPEDGWDKLLDYICNREAAQIAAGVLEGVYIRQFVERLATVCRAKPRAVISVDEISDVFRTIFNADPDERGAPFLLRLPGMTSTGSSEGSRAFVDEAFEDACRAGDVVRFIQRPKNDDEVVWGNVHVEMGELGIRVALKRAEDVGCLTSKAVTNAMHEAAHTLAAPALAYDLVRLLQASELGVLSNGHGVISDGFFAEELQLDGEADLSRIKFRQCYFLRVHVEDASASNRFPEFDRCHLEYLSGFGSRAAVPPSLCSNETEITEIMDEVRTNADVLQSSLPVGVEVLLTVLRKLFVQKGAARQERAFRRGLDQQAQAYVGEVLGLVRQERFATPTTARGPTLWVPNRSKQKEALGMLSSPHGSARLLQKAREI